MSDLLKGGLGGLLAGGAAGSILSGGLGDILNQFQQKGLGDQASSWVSNGPNKQIAPGDLANALGADQIESLSAQTGLSRNELLKAWRQVPARVVNHLTPDGRLPNENELSAGFDALLAGADVRASRIIDASERGQRLSGIIWIIVVGFIAGIIARMLSPGPNNPSGFILTTVLGIAGAFWRHGSARRSASIAPSMEPATSPPPSARWWCCSSGTGWWRGA